MPCKATDATDERRMPRVGSILAILVALLGRKQGAMVEEAAALDWQARTVRGVMSGALVKRFGLRTASEKVSKHRCPAGGRRRGR